MTGTGSVYNSPIDINVAMTVTAPAFSVETGLGVVYYRPGRRLASGTSSSRARPSISAGTPAQCQPAWSRRSGSHRCRYADAHRERSPADWRSTGALRMCPSWTGSTSNPSTGTATRGTTVQLNLVTSAVDYGEQRCHRFRRGSGGLTAGRRRTCQRAAQPAGSRRLDVYAAGLQLR